jgi:hypothetical protein
MQVIQELVFEATVKLFADKKRPIHMGDLKEFFEIKEKRNSSRETWRKSDRIEQALRKLFRNGRLSRSEERVRIENYRSSPFSGRKTTTVNVYFYAPSEYAGKTLSFSTSGNRLSLKFIRHEERKKERPKKEMVLEVLKGSNTAMPVSEILEV